MVILVGQVSSVLPLYEVRTDPKGSTCIDVQYYLVSKHNSYHEYHSPELGVRVIDSMRQRQLNAQEWLKTFPNAALHSASC